MRPFFQKFAIPFYVFITGACVLIIEIVAIRILSPYFGNTIYTVSGVITIVLLALSIGYYWGGKLADEKPEEKVFYIIISASGAVVIFLQLFSMFFLPIFGYKLSIIDGPLISSALLFFLQSLLLGMLSPFAIKLQKTRMEELGVGKVSGQIFFWSTLGSILGSLSAGFILIPAFGIDKIMFGVGFLLIILGLFGGLKAKLLIKTTLVILLIIASLFFIYSINLNLPGVVFAKDGLYQKIMIYDGVYDGKPARFLQQDRNHSAAMFLDLDDLAYEYTKYYALYQIFNKDAKEALSIGGGAYSVPKALLAENPNINVDVAEIDPLIFELGKKYFNLPAEDQRLHNFTEDGRRFLHDISKEYDVIFSDAYASFFSTPEHLTTKEFFELAKSKLTKNGVFIANVVGSLDPKPESFALSEIKTFKNVFKNSYFFAVNSPDSTSPQNLIFVGYNGDNKINFSDPAIIKNKNSIISKLKEKEIDLNKFKLSSYPVLTDNFAPVDYLISKEFTTLRSSE